MSDTKEPITLKEANRRKLNVLEQRIEELEAQNEELRSQLAASSEAEDDG